MNIDNKQKRLLCIVSSMNAGGAETFMMKIYRALDKTKFQIDFLVFIQEEGFYDKEILSMGGKIYYSIPKSNGFIKSFITIKEIVKREKYDYVMRVAQHSISSFDLLAAKQGGARTLVYRSSNSSTGGGRVDRILHILFKPLAKFIPTIKIAPSTEAAEFVFGKNCIKNGNAHIIKNAISLENYLFNDESRNKIRKELGIDDKFVVGHVGRFNKQKNHSFLIDVFLEIHNKKEDSVLLLVGKGELEDEILEKIKKLNLNNRVIFTGVRDDVPKIMMAMDVFVFPSFFEGMPNSVIEAQATGLKCVVADTITKEAQITGLVCYKSLLTSPEEWADASTDHIEILNRRSAVECLKTKGYDIRSSVMRFENIVFT